MLPPTLRLTNVNIAEHLSEETTAFTAALLLDDTAIADVRNDGRGGAHLIRFTDPTASRTFDGLVTDWAEREHVTIEAADRLINALLDLYEVTLGARHYARQNQVKHVACIRKAPYRLDSEPTGYPLSWDHTYLLPLPDGQTIEALADRERADTYLAFEF